MRRKIGDKLCEPGFGRTPTRSCPNFRDAREQSWLCRVRSISTSLPRNIFTLWRMAKFHYSSFSAELFFTLRRTADCRSKNFVGKGVHLAHADRSLAGTDGAPLSG